MADLSKQDRQGVRTPADVERKYNFGKSFAEVTGIATDARTVAEQAQKATENLDANLTQEEIFNRLTNNGEAQGLFKDENGQLYINAEYIVALAKLFAKDITMSGTLTNTVDAFLEPGQEEIEFMQNHIIGNITIPTGLIPDYDFNNDGIISTVDVLMADKARVGIKSLADWTGAKKTPITLTIDLSDPENAICFSGKNMWGREVSGYVGVNSTNIPNYDTESRLKALESLCAVGSVYVTSGENPALTFGGEWTLIKKEFKELVKSYNGTDIDSPIRPSGEAFGLHKLHLMRSGQSMRLILSFVNNVVLNDTAQIVCKINWNALGITDTFASIVGTIAGRDAANAGIMFSVDKSTGVVTITDVLPKTDSGTVAAGNTIDLPFSFNIDSSRMLDAACDKFYWKRTS